MRPDSRVHRRRPAPLQAAQALIVLLGLLCATAAQAETLREAGKVQISDSYILLKDAEAFLFGALITPLPTVSPYMQADPQRTRKLLLHRQQLNRLFGAKERTGYAIIPTAMYWKHGLVKLEIGLARGKKQHDKRETEKRRDWQREQQRVLKQGKG